MQDTTEQAARNAEHELGRITTSIQALAPSSPGLAAAVAELKGSNAQLADATAEWLSAAASAQKALLDRLDGGHEVPSAVSAPPLFTELETLASGLKAAATSIDASQFQKTLSELATKKGELEGRKALTDHRGDIEAEIKRLGDRDAIESARRATDTSTITKKCTALTRSHVTSLVRDQFTRETDRLHLERVTLNDLGGHKGKLRHKPALLGAKMPKPVAQVLSEGEQTALGLAGYFTETHFDGSKSAMVLDDPGYFPGSCASLSCRHTASPVL
jgi:hypothetical protein